VSSDAIAPLDGHPVDGGLSVLVIIPTYNEFENLSQIVARTLVTRPTVNVLVVDDDSPDGTGDLADELAAADDRIHVMHRTSRAGLGAAYLAGFRWGLERQYDVLVEMDSDGSHPPESLVPMLAELDGPGVGLVIGSRWVEGGAIVDWPRSRELLSRAANVYARAALGIRVKDATGGFRAYPADVLRSIDLSGIDHEGYCFQVDLTLRVLSAQFSVVEVPIIFREREFGISKMNGSIVLEAMLKVTAWGIGRRASQLRHLLVRKHRAPLSPP